MKKNSLLVAVVAALLMGFTSHASGNLIMTGVIDGPLSGGLPKAIEFCATEDIADLSDYSFNLYSNGSGTVTSTDVFDSVSLSAGDFYYITNNDAGFLSFMGFSADQVSGTVNSNGDDVYELLLNSSAHDVYGVIGTDGTGEAWEFLDGWGYRNDNTGPSTTFASGDWTYSGINALDGETTNASATTPWPNGTYAHSAAVPEPSTGLIGALIVGLGLIRRRKS